MRKLRWVLAATAVLVAPVSGQSTASVFDRLQGEWEGEGALMGRDAEFTMAWEQEGGLAVLRFTNAFVDAEGQVTPVLSAAAVYRTTTARPEAVWLDSRGVTIEIRWTATDSTLVSDWSAPTESGRTTYRVVSADVVEVVDEVWSGDALQTFGTARYRRRPTGTRGPALDPLPRRPQGANRDPPRAAASPLVPLGQGIRSPEDTRVPGDLRRSG